MDEKNFCFLVHSTRSSQFQGGFNLNYISSSLINNKINDTYGGNQVGFILSPKNIVGANSKDMYINNYVENEEEKDSNVFSS